MASSSNDGSPIYITLVDISGQEITQGSWNGHCKVHELYQAVYKLKTGFLCKLLHGGKELSPQSCVASLCQSFARLTVVWMSGAVQNPSFSEAFAAVKSDGSVITWGDAGRGGDSALVAHRLQEGVVQVVFTSSAFAAVKSDGSVIT
ncbi:unnamed protein product [Polarella glacialis]|uniref:Uncharacterized protein n=1 Tax=Polarella glacialis TaxID=89957 RepID=A0A813I5I3_POLGL|nr:unnamed protein product [Polarella glacialis]CAE8652928.1 unnamed protein product [Polarella glacialis]